MTVENEKYTITHIANGTETEFTFDFIAFEEDDLKVYENGVLTLKAYVVSGLNNKNGGSITFGVAPSLGTSVTIQRVLDYTQEQVFQDGVDYPEPLLEKALDRVTILAQQAAGFTSVLSTVQEKRAQFIFEGNSSYKRTVLLRPGVYLVKDKVATWVAEFRSPAAADTGSRRAYLYLDYSAIITGTHITSTELYWSDDEPVWDDGSMGWYHPTDTDDRCIFAMIVDSNTPGNFFFFVHDGNWVIVDPFEVYDNTVSFNWTSTVNCVPPVFSPQVMVDIVCTHSNTSDCWIQIVGGDIFNSLWSTSLARYVMKLEANNSISVAAPNIIINVDPAGRFKIRANAALGGYANVWLVGWSLPAGM